jgi:SAM-dependent methyltransferase
VRRAVLLLGFAAAGIAPAAAQTPDVMFVPTNIDVALGMLRLAGVADTDMVYDLGSGDGRLVIAAARRYGARGVGIDIDPSLVAEATRNADTAGVADRVSFHKADLFQTDLQAATVVTLYLTPSLNLQLRPKLLAELPPGARVVSNNFDMGEWEPDSTTIVQGVAMANTPVRLWVIPADVRGSWRLESAGLPAVELHLAQRFQHGSGTVKVGGRPAKLTDLRLRGDRIAFSITDGDLGSLRFAGRVVKGRAQGTVVPADGGPPREWRAVRTSRRLGSGRRLYRRHPPDPIAGVVGYEQGTVRRHRQAHRATPDSALG